MAEIKFHGQPVHTEGDLLKVGAVAPDAVLVNEKLEEVSLSNFRGKRVVLNIFPSVDTGVCAASVRKFHQLLSTLENTVVLCISKDLPFAQSRFCAAEGIANVVMLSDFRGDFQRNFPVTFTDGPLKGLFSRCVAVLDSQGKVLHSEQVSETTEEPNYESVVNILNQ